MSSESRFSPALLGEPWLALSRRASAWILEREAARRTVATPYTPDPDAMLYVAASALPYHLSGYTTRTHEVVRALGAAGGRIHALTRAGYPGDRADRLCDAAGIETQVGDVRYLHASAPANNRPVAWYALQAATAIARLASARRVARIHAASNHVNALPALLAARKLGIPFQYEMRGLWELTRISRMPAFEGRQGYKQGLQLEGLVARHADRVFVISRQLGLFARERWGLPEERIFLLPNCVDPDRYAPASPAAARDGTIAYAGSLLNYEGLDTLIDAVSLLVRDGVAVGVDIVGDGEARSGLEAQVRRLGLSAQIRFLGRVSPETAREALGRCALVCLPRKPFKVCEIVPPIKLVEALAMGKPVVAADLPVLKDELGVDPAGWLFRAGDARDLARVLKQALGDRAALARVGARARRHVLAHRTWDKFVPAALPAAPAGVC